MIYEHVFLFGLQWFVWHRLLMSLTTFLTIAGVIVIGNLTSIYLYLSKVPIDRFWFLKSY